MVIVITSPSKALDSTPSPDSDPDEVHIVPLLGREHELSPGCWCHPEFEDRQVPFYIHNLEQ